MATTTNYSWTTPDDTALVKDGAAAIRSLGTAIDTTVFTNAGAAIAKATVDAKGDLIAGTADNTIARLAVGANDTVLTADSSTATGLKWAAPAGGLTAAGCSLTKSANQTLSNATATAITFDGENFDTDAYHDNSTNNSRITIPAGKGGKYVVSARATFASNTTDQRRIQFRVNGSATAIDLFTTSTGVAGEPFGMQATRFLSLSAGDYVEMFAYQASGGNLDLYGDSGAGTGVTFFGAMYLGA